MPAQGASWGWPSLATPGGLPGLGHPLRFEEPPLCTAHHPLLPCHMRAQSPPSPAEVGRLWPSARAGPVLGGPRSQARAPRTKEPICLPAETNAGQSATPLGLPRPKGSGSFLWNRPVPSAGPCGPSPPLAKPPKRHLQDTPGGRHWLLRIRIEKTHSVCLHVTCWRGRATASVQHRSLCGRNSRETPPGAGPPKILASRLLCSPTFFPFCGGSGWQFTSYWRDRRDGSGYVHLLHAPSSSLPVWLILALYSKASCPVTAIHPASLKSSLRLSLGPRVRESVLLGSLESQRSGLAHAWNSPAPWRCSWLEGEAGGPSLRSWPVPSLSVLSQRVRTARGRGRQRSEPCFSDRGP